MFWNQLDEILSGIPEGEELMLTGDLKKHDGRNRAGVERWHGGWTFGTKNEYGGRVLWMTQPYYLALANTFLKKKEEHLITFKSGGNTSVIDYIAIRRDHLGIARNCKVIPGESIATQHRLLISDLTVRRKGERRKKRRPRIKWWRIREEKVQEYTRKLMGYIEEIGEDK